VNVLWLRHLLLHDLTAATHTKLEPTEDTSAIAGSSSTEDTSAIAGSSSTEDTSAIAGSSSTEDTSAIAGSSSTEGTSAIAGSSSTEGTSAIAGSSSNTERQIELSKRESSSTRCWSPQSCEEGRASREGVPSRLKCICMSEN
jgi:hypothetical protein